MGVFVSHHHLYLILIDLIHYIIGRNLYYNNKHRNTPITSVFVRINMLKLIQQTKVKPNIMCYGLVLSK